MVGLESPFAKLARIWRVVAYGSRVVQLTGETPFRDSSNLVAASVLYLSRDLSFNLEQSAARAPSRELLTNARGRTHSVCPCRDGC